MERLTNPTPTHPAARLDPQSRAALKAFLVQVSILAAISLALGKPSPLSAFIVLTAVAGQINSLGGLLSGQRWGNGPLNRWDISMMLFAVSVGARLF